MTLMEGLTIFAILAGPAVGAWLTRRLDNRRELQKRKFEIFRSLMRTRGMRINVDHVSALNLVEVEFIENKEIVSAWKTYLANLSEALPPVEEKDKYDAAVKKRESLLTKLLHGIAKSLKIEIEQLSILEGNYIPQGWVDEDWENRLIRRSLLDVLSSKRAIVIRTDTSSQSSPFPPPPGTNN
jgi:hypothetical protein